MAWSRPMGKESVSYHRKSCLEREEDFPGAALEYYGGGDGEPPMVWAGSGAEALGLSGEVTPADYDRIFGQGAKATRVGRPVSRPGLEVVVRPDKTLSVLGVVGRADDMQTILRAETDAVVAFMDRVTLERGGRLRGQPAPTSGLVAAVATHGTSRAGDPCAHHHILMANVVEVGGKLRAANGQAWSRSMGEATEYSQHLSAGVARQLGYAVDEHAGTRSWAIRGVPDEVVKVFSKRSRQIASFEAARTAAEGGKSTATTRGLAARATRAHKGSETVGQLMPRWHRELDAVKWPVKRVRAAIDAAARKERQHGSLVALREQRRQSLAVGGQIRGGGEAAAKEGGRAAPVPGGPGRERSRVPGR